MIESDPSGGEHSSSRAQLYSSPSRHERTGGSLSVKDVSKSVAPSEEAVHRKELKTLEAQWQSLSKAHQKMQEKYDDCYSKMKSYRKQLESLEKDLCTTRLLNTKLAEEKTDLEQVLSKNKEYTRKLEAMITAGEGRGRGKENLRRNDIVSARAGKDLHLRADLDSAEKALDEERTKNEELLLIKEANGEDLMRLESEAHNLRIERDSFQKSCQELAGERVELLDYIEELNAKIEGLAQQSEEEIGRIREDSEQARNEADEFKTREAELINELSAHCTNKLSCGSSLQSLVRALLQKLVDREQENAKLSESLAKISGEKAALESSANELKQQNSNIRNEYAALKEKSFAMEKAFGIENESLKQTEKCLKDRAEKLTGELDRMTRERDKLRTEISLALSKCQDGFMDHLRATPIPSQSRAFLGLNMNTRKTPMESQSIMNLTPLHDIEESGVRKTPVMSAAVEEEYERYARSEIQDKYRAEQFKNKMLLVEMRTSRLKQQKFNSKSGC